MAEQWVDVRDVDGLIDGHRVTAQLITGSGPPAHMSTGEIIASRSGISGTAFSLPATDEIIAPTGCYWHVTCRSFRWDIVLPSTLDTDETHPVLIGEPSIQRAEGAPPPSWPAGALAPPGGAAGDVLAKTSDVDYAMSWTTGGGGVVTASAPLSLTGTALSLAVGTTAGTVAAGDDSRLSDARTPTAHASTHAAAGSDAVSPASIGAVASTTVTAIWKGTAAAYAALGTYDAATVYVVTA